MSTIFRREDIPYNLNKVIITCNDCNMQFILECILIGKEGILNLEQYDVYFCPYCGKKQRT